MTDQPDRVAGSCADLAELGRAASGCVACAELARTRTQVVVGSVPDGAKVMLIGEAPGADEDAQGVPFVGRSGKLLDRLLAEVGLPRQRVAVANVLKCRPPGNRKPARAEVARCTPWLRRQIELVDPVVLGTLGGTAAEWALGRGVRLASVHGQRQTWQRWPLIATYHPSAAIRFGPNGAPLAALRADLAVIASMARAGRTPA
jgi:DNA polymerase